MSSDSLLLAMGAHVAWLAFLYLALTVARAPAVWGVGRRADGSNPFAIYEPRLTANLRNQFEWPLLSRFTARTFLVLGLIDWRLKKREG